MFIIQWLNTNEKLVTICISFLSLIITTILTIFIIRQTKKLNEQQMQIEEKINIDQTEIQKRQIRIDSYPYKREIYCHVFTVLDLCHQLQDILKSVDLFSKEPAQLMKFFKVLQDQYVPDTKKALWSMREAEYVLPSNISSVVIDIRKNYDSMCAHFITPANISIVLTQHEMETRMNEIKKHNIREAIACCDRIVKHAAFLESIMPLELDISNLSR